MADALDLASNEMRTLRDVLRQFKNVASAANPPPEKIKKIKNQFSATDSKVSKFISGGGAGREWDSIKKEAKQVRDEFQRLDRAVAAKQSAQQQEMTRASQNDAGGDAAGSRQNGKSLGVEHATVVNTAPLDTEEALQKERLQGVVEIEGQMGELKSMYQDFNTMVHDQQEGLDMTEGNVDKSTKHVESGVKELKSASAVQKSSRKWMCALIIIIVLAIAIGIGVWLATRGD